MKRQSTNTNRSNSNHNQYNHKNYPNHKPLHGISRLLTSPTDTMMRLMLCLCFILTLNYIINILNPHYSYADTEYSITYDDNVVTDMPVDSSGKTHDSTIPLPNITPKKPGYIFLGWCNSIPTTTDGTDFCPTTPLQPNSPLSINQTGTENENKFHFYAMWNRNTMQNVAEWGDTIGIGEETTAIDTRDGKTYSVARLCMSAASHTLPTLNTCDRTMLWMTQNLDLVIGTTGLATLSSVDTDINENEGLAYGYSTSGGTITWTPNSTANTPARINEHVASGTTTWTNNNTQPYWGEGDDYYLYTSGIAPISGDNADTIYDSLQACTADNHSKKECQHYHVGNYYNWSAAVATNSSGTYTTEDLKIMPNSLCPKGWRLPNGLTGTNGNEVITEFNQLGLANGITSGITTQHTSGTTLGEAAGWLTEGDVYVGLLKFRSTSTNASGYQAPMYFVQSGYMRGTALNKYAGNGHLWTNTSQASNIAYDLGFSVNGFFPATQSNRRNGYPIRCIARNL